MCPMNGTPNRTESYIDIIHIIIYCYTMDNRNILYSPQRTRSKLAAI